MVRKKFRIPVVFDTNLFIVRYIKHDRTSARRRVFDLWYDERLLQLIITDPIEREYLYVLENYFDAPPKLLELLRRRLIEATNVTRVNLGSRFSLVRDPKDDMLLDAAHAGNVNYLITGDKDLLDLKDEEKRRFAFEIVTPYQFLQQTGF